MSRRPLVLCVLVVVVVVACALATMTRAQANGPPVELPTIASQVLGSQTELLGTNPCVAFITGSALSQFRPAMGATFDQKMDGPRTDTTAVPVHEARYSSNEINGRQTTVHQSVLVATTMDSDRVKATVT